MMVILGLTSYRLGGISSDLKRLEIAQKAIVDISSEDPNLLVRLEEIKKFNY